MSFEHTPKEFGTFSEKDKEKLENITKQAVESNTVENTSRGQRGSYQNPEILKQNIATFFEYIPVLTKHIEKDRAVLEEFKKELEQFVEEIRKNKRDEEIYTELEDTLSNKAAEINALILEHTGKENRLDYIKNEMKRTTEEIERIHEIVQSLQDKIREKEIAKERAEEEISRKEQTRDADPNLN